MPKRYAATKVLTNSSEYYEPLRKPRGLKKLVQYATPKLYHPTASERRALQTTQHIYKYGDRLYTLAYKFYGKAEKFKDHCLQGVCRGCAAMEIFQFLTKL